MDYRIESQPSFSILEVDLAPGEQIVTEAGAMAWMSDNLSVTTGARGGVMGGLKRAVLTAESFFQNTYEAESGPGMIGIAPGQAGNIIAYELQDQELILEKNAYLASTTDVHTDASFEGFRGLFNEGLFALTVSGSGTVFFSGYGDVEEVEVDGSIIVDNGHAVAWEPSLEYEITRARRIRSFLFADQILMRYHGQGKLWVQSRSPRSLANWIYPFRPAPPSESSSE